MWSTSPASRTCPRSSSTFLRRDCFGRSGHPATTSPIPDTAVFNCRAPLDFELAVVVATPAAVLRRDLDHAYPAGCERCWWRWDGIQGRPAEHRRGVDGAPGCAIAGTWPALRDLFQSEIAHRSRDFANGGAALLFGDLDPRVTLRETTLTVDRQQMPAELSQCRSERARWIRILCASTGRRRHAADAETSAWSSTRTMTTPELRPMLIYPARGLATLWGSPTAWSLRTVSRS